MIIQPTPIELAGTALLAVAILHTFSVKWFQTRATQFADGSIGKNLFHLLGEVEVVFGLWAGVFIAVWTFLAGRGSALQYLESRNFNEPIFIFAVMSVAATRPVLTTATDLIDFVAKVLPGSRGFSFYVAALVMGPLMGSLITEPAAMTVTALILLRRLFSQPISEKLKYATLGLLFVTVSIGGTLTPFAAPPVLMVASKWGWDLEFMLTTFGWKAFLTVVIATLMTAFYFRKQLSTLEIPIAPVSERVPLWLKGLHLVFLVGLVTSAHHPSLCIGIFLFFMGLSAVTQEYQDQLKLKESLLVAFFLGGLVVLGGPQRWWLEPVLMSLSDIKLFFGTIGLTAITDNAALTYLGSQVEGLAETAKYALVAGSVVGGGLTVIANAPNPAGYSLLNSSFGGGGIHPGKLFLSALPATLLAAAIFWFLR